MLVFYVHTVSNSIYTTNICFDAFLAGDRERGCVATYSLSETLTHKDLDGSPAINPSYSHMGIISGLT